MYSTKNQTKLTTKCTYYMYLSTPATSRKYSVFIFAKDSAKIFLWFYSLQIQQIMNNIITDKVNIHMIGIVECRVYHTIFMENSKL